MVDMDALVSLCKRRGFIYQSSELYGGVNGCWDYGPMGVELRRNIKDSWWKNVVQDRLNVVGMDSSIIMKSDVWRASGHVDCFTDPMVDCKECKKRYREDHLETETCPECGGELTEAKQFNLMFKTFLGAVEDEAAVVYLRPETAQGIFVQFQNVMNDSRQKLPFGIAQIGKSFRNEVTPRNFIFRSREFEQMEMEFFCAPDETDEWYDFWVQERLNWYYSIGVRKEKLRVREHTEDEMAHYAKRCVDIEYEFPFGWQELEGIADRQNFDLSQHQQFSGKKLEYFDERTKQKYIPHVIETSAGVDRILLTVMVDAYEEEEERTVLRFGSQTAPISVAVFPLMRKPQLKERAKEIEQSLRSFFRTFYDEAGSIGRRYRRQDEVGTPCCVTIDFDTLEDNTVTLRHRDSMEQIRVSTDDLCGEIFKFLQPADS